MPFAGEEKRVLEELRNVAPKATRFGISMSVNPECAFESVP
jgi:hypothetical protein